MLETVLIWITYVQAVSLSSGNLVLVGNSGLVLLNLPMSQENWEKKKSDFFSIKVSDFKCRCNDCCKQLKEAPHDILASFSALEFSEKVLHVLEDENSGA